MEGALMGSEISILEPSDLVAQWLGRRTSYPKVAGSIPTEVRVMIFRSPVVDKLGRTSSN